MALKKDRMVQSICAPWKHSKHGAASVVALVLRKDVQGRDKHAYLSVLVEGRPGVWFDLETLMQEIATRLEYAAERGELP